MRLEQCFSIQSPRKGLDESARSRGSKQFKSTFQEKLYLHLVCCIDHVREQCFFTVRISSPFAKRFSSWIEIKETIFHLCIVA